MVRGKSAAGEYLVLYTDGVTERREGVMFGAAGVVEVVRAIDGSPSQAMAEAVAEAVTSFASSLMDDLEVLVIRRL
jgi:serine phosphatase RsbU (regulator of sigma subunit)